MGRGRDDGAVVQQRKACDFLQAGHKVADVDQCEDDPEPVVLSEQADAIANVLRMETVVPDAEKDCTSPVAEVEIWDKVAGEFQAHVLDVDQQVLVLALTNVHVQRLVVFESSTDWSGRSGGGGGSGRRTTSRGQIVLLHIFRCWGWVLSLRIQFAFAVADDCASWVTGTTTTIST